jgi:antitoxin component YwqK of YwqJK toxin-antitoxin module
MKTIPIISILTLTACSSPTDKQASDNSKDSLVQVTSAVNYETKDTLRTSGDREYIDSANFHIIRGKYVSGNKFIDVYENKLTKLDNWKEYYENGQLKQEGLMTNGNHIYVGIWKYYSNSGKVDSIIDYDKKYPISYYSALVIAEKKGFKMPDMEVALQVDSLNTSWQIARWTENENHGGQTAEAILIDTKTGKVTKPKYQLISIY